MPPEHDDRFRQLVESLPDGMVIVDGGGRIRQVNREAERLFGYLREELLDQTVEVLLPERLRAGHVAHRAAYLATPERRPMGEGLELAGRRKNGTQFPVDISLTPLEVEGETWAVAYVRDVTERTRTERELLLAHLSRAREEERLRVASDLHDDTIQAIVGSSIRLQLLHEQLTDAAQIGLLAKLEASLDAAIARIRHLIFELHPPTLDRDGLAAVIRIYLDQLEAETRVRTELVGEFSEEPPKPVRALMYRVLQEALANVRKHARASMVSVHLGSSEEGFGVTVFDDGAGFEVDGLAHPGHLGVPTMRELIEMSRGWIQIQSQPGRGTCVEFWVPNTDVHSIQPESQIGSLSELEFNRFYRGEDRLEGADHTVVLRRPGAR